MSRPDLDTMTVQDLVARFTALAVEQDKALLREETSKFNRIFGDMEAVKAALKRRDGDQRRALLALYDHPNVHVRLKAAKGTLAVAPSRARALLETIAASGEYPQAGDAGMTIMELDRGTFVPE